MEEWFASVGGTIELEGKSCPPTTENIDVTEPLQPFLSPQTPSEHTNPFFPFSSLEAGLAVLYLKTGNVRSRRDRQKFLQLMQVPGIDPKKFPKSDGELDKEMAQLPLLKTSKLETRQLIFKKGAKEGRNRSEFLANDPRTKIVKTTIEHSKLDQILKMVCASPSYR